MGGARRAGINGGNFSQRISGCPIPKEARWRWGLLWWALLSQWAAVTSQSENSILMLYGGRKWRFCRALNYDGFLMNESIFLVSFSFSIPRTRTKNVTGDHSGFIVPDSLWVHGNNEMNSWITVEMWRLVLCDVPRLGRLFQYCDNLY